jgi:hypothetical protein
MERTPIWILLCATLFVITAALFLIAGAKRRGLNVLLKSAAASPNSLVSARPQLGFFTPWRPGSPAALAPPERRWTYDQDYMIAFVNALERGRGDLGMPGLRYYARPILRMDTWFAVFFAAFIVCTGLLATDHLGEWPWIARAAVLGACLGAVYGVADVAEDVKLRSILMHAERVTGARKLQDAPSSRTEHDDSSEPETADAAQVDAANALTRIKLVMLSASVIGGLAFGILFVADLLVAAASGSPSSGASTPTPQTFQGGGPAPG